MNYLAVSRLYSDGGLGRRAYGHGMSTRLSSADAAWLHMDRPTNLMVINSVLLFDQPVDWERAKEITQRRLVDRYPRFREKVVDSRRPFGPPRWELDADFALEHHMHHLAMPSPGDPGQLQELAGELMTVPLDRNRPLWQSYLVDGYREGAALIVRMHHCIADGIALARVMFSLTDAEAEAGIEPLRPGYAETRSRLLIGGAPVPGTRRLKRVLDAGATVARQGAHIAASPRHAARVAGAVTRDGTTALKLLLTPADAATALKGEPRVSRRVAWSEPLSLAMIKRTAHANEATVNDVLLAAVSGGLRHYLRDRHSPVGEIQAMVPFNLRPLERAVPRSLGNRFGLVLVSLPVGVSGSYRRLVQVSRRMDEIKRSREPAVSYGILSAAGVAPSAVQRRIVDMFSAKGTVVLTNVPGPTETVYFAGTAVRSVLVWAPTSGHIGMSISIFSYRGEVTVGLMVDAALVPDPEQVVAALSQELARLEEIAPGHGRRRAPVRVPAGIPPPG